MSYYQLTTSSTTSLQLALLLPSGELLYIAAKSFSVSNFYSTFTRTILLPCSIMQQQPQLAICPLACYICVRMPAIYVSSCLLCVSACLLYMRPHACYICVRMPAICVSAYLLYVCPHACYTCVLMSGCMRQSWHVIQYRLVLSHSHTFFISPPTTS